MGQPDHKAQTRLRAGARRVPGIPYNPGMAYLNLTPELPDRLPPKSVEIRLWTRVLWLAVLDAAGHAPAVTHGDHDAAQDDAWEWIDAEGTDPGGFAWVCDRLGMDAALVRDRLQGLDHPELVRSHAVYRYRPRPLPQPPRPRRKRRRRTRTAPK